MISSSIDIAIQCACGFTIRVEPDDLTPIALGFHGTISCPNCNVRMNDKIKQLVEKRK